jgi:hypothetical protein
MVAYFDELGASSVPASDRMLAAVGTRMLALAAARSTSDRVVIGIEPHKRSATIEVMAGTRPYGPHGGRRRVHTSDVAAFVRAMSGEFGNNWPAALNSVVEIGTPTYS